MLKLKKISEEVASQFHSKWMDNKGEALDGDEVEIASIFFRRELNKLNGNK
jgi:hypothetical protein